MVLSFVDLPHHLVHVVFQVDGGPEFLIMLIQAILFGVKLSDQLNSHELCVPQAVPITLYEGSMVHSFQQIHAELAKVLLA